MVYNKKDMNIKYTERRERRLSHPARIIITGFLAVIFVGTILLWLPISNKSGKFFHFIDALFTATSAVCVTGLTVVDTAVNFNLFGQIVLLLLIQIGGLGFMVMTTLFFLIAGKRITLKDKLNMQEAISANNLKDLVLIIKKILLATLIIEGIGFLSLLPGFIMSLGFWQGVYAALFHSISAFCNAGFDVLGTIQMQNASLLAYQSSILVLLPIMMLIITGGLGFGVLIDIFKVKKWSKFSILTKLVIKISLVLIFVGTAFFFVAEYNNAFKDMSFGEKLLNSFFQSISPRTAGYATVDQAMLTQPSRIMTMILMFIGASPASCGGGIKTITFFVILSACIKRLKSDDDEVLVYNKAISSKMMNKSFSVLFLAVAVVTVLVFLTSITETFRGNVIPLEDLLFEAISAFGTVGLTVGVSFELGYLSKILFSIVMLIGRIGPFTLGIAIAKKNNSKKVNIKHQEAQIVIG